MRMRSFLYVPADSERFVGKAHERGAHAIVLDLEDGVAPEKKAKARAALKAAVRSVCRNGATVFVRINSTAELARNDAEAACRAGAFGLFVPKTQTPEQLADLAAVLEPIETEMDREPMQFVALLEDPDAVLDARFIARAPRVLGLICGTEDLATAMGAEAAPDVLRMPKLLVHLAAKAAGVRSFGVLRSMADFSDTEGIAAAAVEARRFGFDGSTCIHPKVVPILNEAFAPSAEEVARAERLVAAAEVAFAAGRGAFAFEGSMVDKPIVERAMALLERA